MRKIVLLLAALLVLPACGGDSVAADPVAEAATKTTEAGSSRIEFTMAMEAEGRSLTMRGEGVFDYSPPIGRMTLDLGNLAELAGGELGNGRVEFVLDGAAYYMKFPQVTERFFGKQWLKIDLEEVGELTGADLGALQQANQNPAQLMQFLRGASDDIEELGKEEVRGVETTHYRARVDLDEAAERGAETGELSDEMREQLQAEIERMKAQTGLETLPVDVWLDEDNLLRRMQMDLSFAVKRGQVGLDMTMDFFDFGVDVRVAPPPADETVDITELATQEGS
jgi:hypothetical protein